MTILKIPIYFFISFVDYNRRCDLIAEGQLPKGAAYLEESVSANNRPLSDERPLISPGEISKYRSVVS